MHRLQAVFRLAVCGVGADIHQVRDVPAGAVDGVILEELADLVKEHDGHRLQILLQQKRADGGDAHEEILIEYLAVANVAEGLPQHLVAEDEIGGQEEQGLQPRRFCRQQRCYHHRRGACRQS